MSALKLKSKEIAAAKKAKKELRSLFARKVHFEDPTFAEKMKKLDKELQFYDKIIHEGQNKVTTINCALKKVGKPIAFKQFASKNNGEEINHNFGKRKTKFGSKDAVSKKKMRTTEEGQKKQHQVDNASKQRIRSTPEGRRRHQEESEKLKREFRDSQEGENKQHQIDNASKQRIRGTPEGQKKQQETDNASKQRIRSTPEGRNRRK